MPPLSFQSWPSMHTYQDYARWLDEFRGLPPNTPSIIRQPATAVSIDGIVSTATEAYVSKLVDLYQEFPEVHAPSPHSFSPFIHALPDNNRRGIMPLTFNQHGAVSVLRSDATATPVNHERLLLRTHQACLALFQAHQSGQSTSHVIRSYSLVRRSFGAPSRQISAHLTWLTQAILFAEIRFVSHPTPALKSEPIQKAGGIFSDESL
ncbi:hypothetical protein B0H14DRAFT_3880446 [Mycena olivaceomarginata]|nr:hypothetical protein B0H14DRAFT_3880446 [Mycena olivaceomarginata]